MKSDIFTSLSYAKAAALLKDHTAADKKSTEGHVWKYPGKNDNAACLVGKWEGDRFNGKMYRVYNGTRSGGIGLPRIKLSLSAAGELGKLELSTRLSDSFWLMIAAFVFIGLLQINHIVTVQTLISVLVLAGWIVIGLMTAVMTIDQYRHESAAIEQVIKDMTRAFD